MTIITAALPRLPNYVGGHWVDSGAGESVNVINPATGEAIAQVPLAGTSEVGAAVEAAAAAYPAWRRTPPEERIQPLFKLKTLLEDHLEPLSQIITRENGKTLAKAKRRCGAPSKTLKSPAAFRV